MKKGYYYFGECGALEKVLVSLGAISLIFSGVCLCMGGYYSLLSGEYYFTAENAWCLFFLALSVLFISLDVCLHKICRDIATLLKETEEKHNRD